MRDRHPSFSALAQLLPESCIVLAKLERLALQSIDAPIERLNGGESDADLVDRVDRAVVVPQTERSATRAASPFTRGERCQATISASKLDA